jgi:site-specific DNA recombinase
LLDADSRRRLRGELGLSEVDTSAATLELKCDTSLRRVGAEMRFTVSDDVQGSARQIPSLTRAIVNARDWLDRILRGDALNQRDLAKQTGHDERYISKILPLAFLAPDITEEILEGSQPAGLYLDTIAGRVVHVWHEQRQIFRMAQI